MKVTTEPLVVDKTTTTVAVWASDAQMATNPNTNPQLLRKIATEKDWELRRLVASNPNTPTDVLWQLGIDFPEAILSNPIFELLQIEQLQLVAEIPNSTLISLLQCERAPKNFMEYAVNQQDYSLWLAVAYNPHTPSALLENLAQKSRRQDRELIRAVAAHPHTPKHLLAEIIDIGGGIAQIVAENPHTPVAVLEKILDKYRQTNDPIFTTLVALHPQIAPQLLMQMGLAPNESAAQSLWLAKQSATTSSQLVELAQTSWDILRLAVVRHPHALGSTIEQIWHQLEIDRTAPRQIDRLIYDSFVANPNTSSALREELRKLLQL
ncbi:hypothetical protein [Chamaesiphon sp. VAR_48_metabat_135_sub]|uniref:variant leucine-rich repeat-containing protein n=1 Tax=Chamaesiphon sp. VAR_48_metabat_135_sub TaxID=2964699 RepID=UPI00286BEFB4|nr:hypothetical protein [Chamaesiphon sp. VAR_48_metabat_135_sub]